MMSENSNDVTEIIGEVIYAYTRAQAIEDGVLVDLTHPGFTFRPGLNICQEARIKCPVAMTATAYAKAVEEEGVELPPCQDISGRLWDVLYMFTLNVKTGKLTDRNPYYTISVVNWIERDGRRTGKFASEDVKLKAVFGPGDHGEPVLTIMLPNED